MTSLVGEGLAVRVGSGTGWQFVLLGPFAATFDDEPFASQGLSRDLLAALLTTAGEPQSPQALAAALWGEDQPDNANRAVLASLSRLRRAMAAVDRANLILERNGGYLVDIDRDRVDLVRVQRLVRQGRRALEVGQPQVAAARLGAALDGWRGEPMADIDRPFAIAQRQRLAELRLTAAELWVDAALAAKRSVDDSLVAALERLVAANPGREAMWAKLITVLHRAGRAEEARETVGKARARFVPAPADPATPPPPLPAAIAAAEAALATPYKQPPPALAETLPAPLLAVGPTCLGREGEIAALSEVMDAAVCDGGQVRLLIGPAGIGKTRLMAELASRAAVRGARIRFGSGADPAAVLSEQVLQVTPGRLNLVLIDDTPLLSPEARMRLVAWLSAIRTEPVMVVLAATSGQVPPELAAVRKFVVGSLAALDVAEVVRQYVPGVVEAAALSAAAGASGVPAQIHRAAARWAQGRASRRVDRAAGEMDNWRRGLRAVEAEIASGVMELEHIRVQSQAYQTRGLGGCPYPGLPGFAPTDADLFHGRAAEVANLVARLAGAGLLALVGAQGTGKTSLVNAGLLPVLGTGVLPGSAAWAVAIAEPETVDLAALADEPPNLLVIDRWERVFTHVAADRRAELIDTLIATAVGGRTKVVLVMTGTGLASCARYPALARLVSENVLLLAEPTTEQFRLAIERPAIGARLVLDEGLVDKLVADAAAAPAPVQLAGLAIVLRRLYEHRVDGRLTAAAYQVAVGDAVADLAERCLSALTSAPRREAAITMAVRVATAGRMTRDAVLAGLNKRAAGPEVLGALVADGVLVLDGDRYRLAHEVLSTAWPRLRDAIAKGQQNAKGSESGRGSLARRARVWSITA
jgi:DNA-binding SARP family transcriptional activator